MSEIIEIMKVRERKNGRKHINVPVDATLNKNDYVLVRKINQEELRRYFENKTNC